MNDFEIIARRAVDSHVVPPASPDVVRRRAGVLARRRRRWRLIAVATGAVAVSAGVLAGIILPGTPHQVVVATPGPATTVPRHATRRPATIAQVEAFEARLNGRSQRYEATWAATVHGRHGPVHVTVVSAAGPNGSWFYRLPPSVYSGVPGPPGLQQPSGSSYALYSTSHSLVSCARPGSPSAAWSCVSWAGVSGVGMGETFQLNNPYPPYTLPTALSNALYSYGYQQSQPLSPGATPVYLYRSSVAGQPSACLRVGPIDHPDGHACINRNGLIDSYAFPMKDSISTPYLSLTLRTYRADPPATIFVPPAPVQPPSTE